MKFLVDAQLPKKLCVYLRECGQDALHTLELPRGNRTSDTLILDIAQRDGRVVITKDDDFVQSHLVHDRPEKLLLVATGNIGNAELEKLFRANLVAIVNALETGKFVEIDHDNLLLHA